MKKTEHPKVLVVDLPSEVDKALAAAGFNVRVGTYGAMYQSKERQPVWLNHALPNFTEQEIVFLSTSHPHRIASEAPTIPHQFRDYRTVGSWTDPRPLSMLVHRGDADRIRQHGGVFIVFASAVQDPPYGQIDNWYFLSREHWFKVRNDSGSEIKADHTHPCGRVLARHLNGASFTCTFNIGSHYKEWRPIAWSKYGSAVAGLIKSEDGGLVIVVPQLKDPAAFAVDLTQSYLPDEVPGLFPEMEGGRWVHRPEYEQPQVVALERQIEEIRADADRRLADVETAIRKHRADAAHYYELLTGTGGRLVNAVEENLKRLGFTNIVNVDASKADQDLREDLQLLDGSPAVLVEVKGISGLPADDDLLAAGKYIAIRMKEMNRLDIVSLTVINYERHRPALERAADPFREVVITSALKQHIGLMTSWDLFRLVRGAARNAWPHATVAPLFAQPGRIEPIPIHYEYIGVVHGFIENLSVVGVQIEQGTLSVGDRLAYELPVDFIEEPVVSLQSDNVDIQTAAVGRRVGMTTSLTKGQARDGVRVFRVHPYA